MLDVLVRVVTGLWDWAGRRRPGGHDRDDRVRLEVERINRRLAAERDAERSAAERSAADRS